ncbi:MAG: PLP-dependent aminotransferase family protein [Verrucomicrobiales bacterium]|nr:PLP-dependent aminotransferase family protein [Verrucomicrobiales bacterium]
MSWNSRFAARSQQMKRSAVRELLKLTERPDMISFAGGLPAPELFPLEEIRVAVANVLATRGNRALQYGETEGVPELRDWIAARFRQPGLPITRANVMIVTGAQQGLDLLGRVLLDPGDRVIVENPTYLALLSAWRPLGIEFLAAPSDSQGIQLEGLDSLLLQAPKLLYTIPNFQNPGGTTLSTPRRETLVDWARRNNVGLIEDDPYGELRFEGTPPPTLMSLDARHSASNRHDAQSLHGNVAYCGTFSKVLAPGLRVGWIIAPEELLEKLVQAKQATDLHTSSLSQHLCYQLLLDGVMERQIPRLQKAYGERRDTMLAALTRYFPEGIRWNRPEGGMFLLVALPESLDAQDVLREAIRHNVAFVPGEEFHLNGQGKNTLRLNFSNASCARIEEGMKRLGEVVKQLISAKGIV